MFGILHMYPISLIRIFHQTDCDCMLWNIICVSAFIEINLHRKRNSINHVSPYNTPCIVVFKRNAGIHIFIIQSSAIDFLQIISSSFANH